MFWVAVTTGVSLSELHTCVNEATLVGLVEYVLMPRVADIRMLCDLRFVVLGFLTRYIHISTITYLTLSSTTKSRMVSGANYWPSGVSARAFHAVSDRYRTFGGAHWCWTRVSYTPLYAAAAATAMHLHMCRCAYVYQYKLLVLIVHRAKELA